MKIKNNHLRYYKAILQTLRNIIFVSLFCFTPNRHHFRHEHSSSIRVFFLELKSRKRNDRYENCFLSVGSGNFLTHRKLWFHERYLVYEMLGTLYASTNSHKIVMTEISSLLVVQCLRGVAVVYSVPIGKQSETSPQHSTISRLNSIVLVTRWSISECHHYFR